MLLAACLLSPGGPLARRGATVVVGAFRITERRRGHPSPHVTARLYSSPADADADEVDPYSDVARSDLSGFYSRHPSLPDDDAGRAHASLLRLTEAVLAWNSRVNLVSRKDCTASVVYHRHVLPSASLLPLLLERAPGGPDGGRALEVADVGTGGGFPGLPLAVLAGDKARFTLVDSVRKKVAAVGDMASDLDAGNVRVHCGRAEEMSRTHDGRPVDEHYRKYDVVLGRSVTSPARFCAWVSDLLRPDTGRLVYIIGGDLDPLVEDGVQLDVPLDELLGRRRGTSDKRAVVFNAEDVRRIAEESGEAERIVRSGPGKKKGKGGAEGGQRRPGGGRRLAKGAWAARDGSSKKERGYENFQRYES